MEGKGGDYREIIIWQSWENGESSNGPVWRKKRRKLLAGRREDGLRQFWRTIASVWAWSKSRRENFLFIKSSKKHHSHSLRKECVQYVYQSKSKYYFLTNCICCQDYTRSRLDIDWSLSTSSWLRSLGLTSLLQVDGDDGVALAWVELVCLKVMDVLQKQLCSFSNIVLTNWVWPFPRGGRCLLFLNDAMF